ncbi:MAG TPA: DNA replication/repair protein RecF [Alphaproteobacteria bacterium]|nr:DNA replication/repair protein RecF [Alphaproteobacteria bacterium]
MIALLAEQPTIAMSEPGSGRGEHAAPSNDVHIGPAVRRVVLTDFRNYARLRLDVDARPVVLTGPNGAGKTNLLEALSLLAPGRGLRRARLGQLVHGAMGSGEEPGGDSGIWAVAAQIVTPDGPVEMGTAREIVRDAAGEYEGERRVVRIDGKTAKGQGDLARYLSVAWLTPEMDRLFVEASSGRRRFIDRLVYGFVPDHASRVSAYERAMRERSRLLRDGGADASWLAALEAQMAEAAVAIAAARRDLVARLNQAGAAAIGPFPRPEVSMRGAVESWLGDGPALAAEDRFRETLAASRRRDAEAGGAAEGPHRSDLHVIHAVRGVPAAQCSTGEQKALLIALVLAAARLRALEHGAAPILLLDEVVAHLDETRRAALFDELVALGAQAWLTGTDRALFDALEDRAQFLDVADGAVRPAASALDRS